MRIRRGEITFIWLIMVGTMPANAQSLPTKEYACMKTTVDHVEHRLQDGEDGPFIPDSGSAITFTNGGYQVSYDEIKAVQRSRSGDPVFMCLIKIPQNCPAGDARGRIYTTTNLRTLESWTMPDAEHGCGGA